MSIAFDYDHRHVVSPLKLVQQRRDIHGFQPAFGSSNIRFELAELTPNPGVGEYDPHGHHSLLKKSQSFSSRGYGNGFASKNVRPELFQEKDVPGPAHYRLPAFGYLSPDNRRPSTSFIPSGNGRVPFDPPKDVPGPSDYVINHDPGRSPFLKRKSSATFESVTTRDSFFDKMSPAPGPGKYKSEKANHHVYSTGGNVNIDFKRSSIPDRFDHIGKDNKVPGVHSYFQKPFINPHTDVGVNPHTGTASPTTRSRPSTSQSQSRPSTSHSQSQSTFGEFVEPLPSPMGKKILVRTGSTTSYVLDESLLQHSTHHYDNEKIPSLRSVGNFRGRHMGKQNQIPILTHTFGADKDRFKNSVFGRLDLAAQIPGPGTYDYPLEMGKVANKKRAQTAPESSKPKVGKIEGSHDRAAHLSFKPLRSPKSNQEQKKPGHQFEDF